MRNYPLFKLELGSGKIIIGQTDGFAEEKTPSGAFTLSAAGVATADPAIYNVAQVTITSAQLLALYTTAIEIVPAPGANKILLLDHCVVKYVYGTAAYTIGSATNLAVKYTDGSGTSASATQAVTGMIDQTTNQIRYLPALATALTPVVNAKFVMSLAGANPTSGDGTLVVTTIYRIVTP